MGVIYMNIKLIADSTCDLSDDLIQKYNIRIAPLNISMGDSVLRDGAEITAKNIFDYVESGKGICHTSAVNIDEYSRIYSEERPNCDAIIHFTISEDMSSCYQNARVAAEEFDNIYHVDSRNLSTAIGHLVLDAAELSAQGLPRAAGVTMREADEAPICVYHLAAEGFYIELVNRALRPFLLGLAPGGEP